MSTLVQVAGAAKRLALDQPATLGDSDCEALRPGVLGQPVNTISSAAFVVSGAWLAARLGSVERSQRPAAAGFATLVALNGLGSMAYHGAQFPGAQLLHDAPAGGVIAASGLVPLWRKLRGRHAFPGWSSHHGGALVLTEVIAVAAYVGGRSTSPLCQPESLFQLHGLWHAATAATVAIWATVLWPVDTTGSSSHGEAIPDGDVGSSGEINISVSTARDRHEVEGHFVEE